MTHANKIFDSARQTEITQRVEQLEQKTSAEIVCAVANESGRYDRAESIIGLLCAFILLVSIHALSAWWVPAGDWTHSGLSMVLQIPILVVGFVLGSILASYWFGFRRFFTRETEMAEEVDRAACLIFTRSSIGETDTRCGLLIYLSLFEHKVVLLADQAVREVLSDQRIQELCDLAVSEIKAGRISRVFETLMDALEPELSKHLPADRELNPNELSDHVLIANRF